MEPLHDAIGLRGESCGGLVLDIEQGEDRGPQGWGELGFSVTCNTSPEINPGTDYLVSHPLGEEPTWHLWEQKGGSLPAQERGGQGGSRTHDQASYRDHNLLRKLLDDVIEFGFGLGDLSVSEGSLRMKKPQVCPKIRELDGNFGDVLGWSFCLVHHDAIGRITQILRKTWNWIAFNCMIKVWGHQYWGREVDL